ncbi:hypothetical protein LOTGIDRAFT_160245 [Lottia gigantea]|uniref:Thioredoxin domain-containing protein n=1 Tax=Lottia gigantea TaxID=225164 RepID=V4C2G0_LOTGI|nr:hypothetical protein LOTGIDRAFT_160245 [Lottia gigantea]ESO95694.1 hypothetical protein LOTGIDRAFT_160245 [Lottia gigantea]
MVKQEVKALSGKAAIGGPWSLVDFNGELKTSKDFHGKWILVYFGFTHCPDICPEELEKIAEVVDEIDDNPNVPNLTPLFITVDPDRDTIGAMKEYLKEFSQKVIGFTGTSDQIDNVCKAFRVYYSKGPLDEDGDYIVDHTIITYLVGPDGNFVQYYGQNVEAPEFTKSVIEKMKTYKPHYDK